MAQVTYNSIKRFRYYGQELDENEREKPQEETLRDAILHQVFRNQSKTHLDIEECLKNKEKFTSGTKQNDFSSSASGLLSNETFKNVCNDFDVKEVLASCDLDESEISVLLNAGRGKESDEAYFQKLKNVELKLEKRRDRVENCSPDTFSGVVKLNRHDFEEECKKIASDTAEKLTSCLIQLKPSSNPFVHPDHPINRLSDLKKQLFPEGINHQSRSSSSTKRKCEGHQDEGPNLKYFSEKPKSFWDMKEIPILLPQQKGEREVRGCAKQMPEVSLGPVNVFSKKEEEMSQDYSKPFVWSLRDSELVPLATINSNKLTIEEIKKEEKFCNYNPGMPSSALYLKNLPRKVMPISLVSLFGRFEKENGKKIEYRILKGKMKGQAFVKFNSIDVAIQAFSMINGYVLERKPIVIEYGKKIG